MNSGAAPAPAAPSTSRAIARFWHPLAATWIMMALEGPILAAAIARMPDPTVNLAAHGVAFAIAILVEAPVMMLMSAATALVQDGDSYRRLRRFAAVVNGFATGLLCLLLVPPAFDALALRLLQLPPEIARLVYGALWFYLPWAAAIGYRRFVHGVMIRSGKTRQVAAGTALRLVSAAGVMAFLTATPLVPGAWAGALGLVTAVCVEAVAARAMAAGVIRQFLADGSLSGPRLGWRAIFSFYWPLALTQMMNLASQPLATFFMTRGRAPLESLAVFPVVHALAFLFRAVGLSYQEVVIALGSSDRRRFAALDRFGGLLALASATGLALAAFTPLFGLWFERVSGLTPDLAAHARLPTMILVPMPALSVWLACQRGKQVLDRRTIAITSATALELATIAAIFFLAGQHGSLTGATAAALAFLVGRAAANFFLHAARRRSG